MSVQVITKPDLQVTGIRLLAPPAGNNFPDGVPATAIPTVPTPPQTATLKPGQWIMDPSQEFVLILDSALGLVLYQNIGGGDPTSGQFQGDVCVGP